LKKICKDRNETNVLIGLTNLPLMTNKG